MPVDYAVFPWKARRVIRYLLEGGRCFLYGPTPGKTHTILGCKDKEGRYFVDANGRVKCGGDFTNVVDITDIIMVECSAWYAVHKD